MTTLVSGTRTPVASHAAPVPEAGGVTRPDLMRVWAQPLAVPGLAPDDAELRRIWVAIVGAGAVEDLLKMMGCARRRERIRRPLFLPALVTAGLAAVHRDVVWVPEMLPPVPARMARTLPPPLRRRERAWRRRVLTSSAA